MGYIVDVKDDKWSVYYRGIEEHLLQGAPIQEVYITLSTIIEYDAKLNIVKLLMTFPHGFYTIDDEKIVHEEAVEEFENWFSEIKQMADDADQLHTFIDEKIHELFVK